MKVSSQRLRPRLIVFTDLRTYADGVERLAALCAQASPGAVLVVLRDRQLPDARRLDVAQKLARTIPATGQHWAISGSPDWVGRTACDGLHLPAAGARPSRARAAVGSAWLSRAGHGWRELKRADLRALDALLVSPVMAERKGRGPLGASGLRTEIEAIERAKGPPVFALGGIEAANVRACLDSGAQGVAVIGAAHDSKRALALLDALARRR